MILELLKPSNELLIKAGAGSIAPQLENFEKIQAGCIEFGRGLVPPLLVLAVAYKQSVGQGRILKNCCGTPKLIEDVSLKYGVFPQVTRSLLVANPQAKLQYYCRFQVNEFAEDLRGESRFKNFEVAANRMLACLKYGLFLIPGCATSYKNSESEIQKRVPVLIQNESAQIQLIVRFLAKTSAEVRHRADWSTENHWNLVLSELGKMLHVRHPHHWASSVIGLWYFFRERYLGKDYQYPDNSELKD